MNIIDGVITNNSAHVPQLKCRAATTGNWKMTKNNKKKTNVHVEYNFLVFQILQPTI